MTDEQKTDILSLYNAAAADLARALDLMDSDNPKISRKGDEKFVDALARQDAIDRVLDIMGFSLVIDDGDGGHAIAIK